MQWAGHMNSDARNRRNRPKIRWLGAGALATIALAPPGAHAQNAEPSLPLPALAAPATGPLKFNPPPAVLSWLDMVSATQAAQPNWMTPLVTVTPRLEQELRADFYGQQNGTGSQGNGQPLRQFRRAGRLQGGVYPRLQHRTHCRGAALRNRAAAPRGTRTAGAIARFSSPNTASCPRTRTTAITSSPASFR